MRNITKFKRSIRAISPVISVLLMIAIAVVASLVAYAWVMGYMNFQTSKVGNAIQIPSYASQGGFLTIYVQNVGQGTVNLVADSSVYVNDQLRLITASPSGSTVNPTDKIPIGDGNTVEIVTDYPYTVGEKVTIKIVTYEGATMTVKGTTSSSGSGTTTPLNQAPVLDAIEDKSVIEETLLSFTATASDADSGDVLTFSLVNAPSGASIDSSTGVFTWTPTAAQGPNAYTFTVVVTDNGSPAKSDQEEITVTVSEENYAPELNAIGNKVIAEGQTLTFTAEATDSNTPAQTLTFSLGAGSPTGASIDASTGVFTWTPTEAQGPSAPSVEIIVSDGIDTDSETITITVSEVNQAPSLADISESGDELSLITFTVTATDADEPANTLTYSLSGQPSGASITSAGVFTWTPTEAQDGDHSFSVIVSDGTTTTTSTINIEVNEVVNPTQTITLQPNGAGSTELSQYPTGEWRGYWYSFSNYEQVDEATFDEATYVYGGSEGYALDTYATSDHGSVTGTIQSVTVHIVCRASGLSSSQSSATCYAMPALRIGSNNYYGTEVTLTNTYEDYSYTWFNNPAGGSWGTNWANIDSLRCGVRLDSGDTSGSSRNYAVCTQVYVVVTYS